MRTHFLLLSLAALLLLASCASDQTIIRGCPQVAILRELDTTRDYARERPTPENLVALSRMRAITGQCSYEDDKTEVNFTIAMQSEKGPRLGGDSVSVPYFVSVIGPDDQIVSKQTFAVRFDFPSDRTIADKLEDLSVAIPLKKDETASAHRVLVGFQLTAEELEAARSRISQGN